MIFIDNFNRTATTLGSNWQVQYGSFSTSGTFASSGAPPVNGNWVKATTVPGTSDYAVSADIVIPAGSSFSGVVARSSNAAQFDSDLYAAQIFADGTVNLYRRNSWTWTVLQSLAAGIVAGTSYNVKLVAAGSNPVHLEVWVNGAQKISYDDSSTSRLTSGAAGIQAYVSGVQYRHFEIDGVFFDAFNRTVGLGSSWTVAYGSFGTDGAHAVSGAPPLNGNWAAVSPAVATDDYSVSASIIVPPSSANSGIVARSNDGTAFDATLYALELNSTDGTVNLYRRNSWNSTLLVNANAGIVSGLAYATRLVVTGSSPVHLEGWVNGTQYIGFDDASAQRISVGNCGIVASTSGVQYTNFKVGSVPPRLFADGFDRTTGVGENWSMNHGTYTTNGAFAVSGAPPVNGNWAGVVPSLGSSDVAVSADLVIPAGSMYSGVVARSAVATNFDSDLYAAQLSTDGTVALYRRNSWNWTLLASLAAGITAGPSYKLRLVAIGASPVHLEVWLDGIQKLTYDDASTSQLASGNAGIETYASGVQFANFAVEGVGNVTSVTSITVSPQGVGSATFTSNPVGLDCPGTACTMTVAAGTNVAIAARPATGSAFAGWAGPCSGVGSCMVAVRSRQVALAQTNAATVDVLVSPNGINSDVGRVSTSVSNGTCSAVPSDPNHPSPYSTDRCTVVVGSTVTVTAVAFQPYHFVGWDGLCSGSTATDAHGFPTCTFAPTSNGSVDGNFAQTSTPATTTWTVTVTGGQGQVTSTPAGINCPGVCSMTTTNSTSAITVTASPAAGYILEMWASGAGSCGFNGEPCSVPWWGSSVSVTFAPAPAPYPCNGQPCAHGQFPPGSWHPYGPRSAFNKPLPADVHDPTVNSRYLMGPLSSGYLGSDSAAIVGYMLNTIAHLHQIENIGAPANHLGGWPTYYGLATDPTYTVACAAASCDVSTQPGHAPVGGEIQGRDPAPVLPNGAVPDRHLTFIDQSTGFEYDLWHVFFSGYPQVTSPLGSAGGTIQTDFSGYTAAFGADGRAIGVGEGNAGRVGNLAGRIRLEELNDAVAGVGGRSDLGHALAITVNCSSGVSAYPAFPQNSGRSCNAIGLDNTKAPPMGARIFLDLTDAQIDTLSSTLPRWKKVILWTLARYGAIIMDTGSDKYFTLHLEAGNQYTSMNQPDAWQTFGKCMFDGLNCTTLAKESDWEQNAAGDYTGTFHDLADGLTWSTQVWPHLKVLDECVSTGGCNP